MHYFLLQLPLSQEEGPSASATTAGTTCNGVDTAEKAQRSLLCGGTTNRTTLVLMTCYIIMFDGFS